MRGCKNISNMKTNGVLILYLSDACAHKKSCIRPRTLL